ncbi:MAG: hypothetical protein ACMVY4_17865 [Minwuia sp.]|uniref:Ppx/GppA phosphatase family protein n=1 Tax=Minwuia sp. TaxID=2493630 RepID=UPI003A8885D0
MPDTMTAARTDRTAVIDVGSNSVRLVIFGDCERAPLAMLNEKAFCALGRGVSATGHLNAEGVEHAIRTLRRFSWMASCLGARRVNAFATAAVRDADDGPDFVERAARETGVELRVLSGEEEAHLAAQGVLFGIPEAEGLVGDMGGSSLELAEVGGGVPGRGISLPLGPLQFADDDNQADQISKRVAEELSRPNWLGDGKTENLYLVGGTWRAFAKIDIAMRNYGLNIIHGYQMTAARALDLADLIAGQHPDSLAGEHGVSKRRLQVLPAASMVLKHLVGFIDPARIIFSAHGVREGAYLEGLDADVRAQDPLIAGVRAIAAQEARFSDETGKAVFDWISPLFTDETDWQRRLRLAACLLCDTGWRTHPDYRATQSYRRVLRAPLLALNHAERTFISISVLRRYSHKAGDEAIRDARTLLGEKELLAADRIGAAMRLALTLGGGGRNSLQDFSLSLSDNVLTLQMPSGRPYLASDAVDARLKHLATLFFARPLIDQ